MKYFVLLQILLIFSQDYFKILVQAEDDDDEDGDDDGDEDEGENI